MIGSLRGRLTRKSIDEVTLDVGGIGWRVWIPLSTYEALPAEGEEAALVTHLHVREDELTLYGFASARERRLFETLIGVSGVGPRLALHVLSRLTPDRFVAAIRRQDLTTLTGISGVGKKTAERLVLELKDKVAEFAEVDTADGEPVRLTTNGEDAVKALVALGIGRAFAERAVQQSLAEAPEAAAPELTRRALSSIRE
ncbi:MAG TPA: Holliday junction branch migration protein RuvA [Gemmatimonadota bacterium]|nr:Holliday junction branch migration protein RuvA [Gemmatimonadota bacterium]